MSRTAEENAETAAALRHAADIIEAFGYTPYPDYEGEKGTGLHAALEVAAGEFGIFTEHAENALAGYLQLTGQLDGGASSYHADGRIAEWERAVTRRPAADVTAALRAAADVLQPPARGPVPLSGDEQMVVSNAQALLDAAAEPSLHVAADILARHGWLTDSEAANCNRAVVYAAGFGAAGTLVRSLSAMLQARAGGPAMAPRVPARHG